MTVNKGTLADFIRRRGVVQELDPEVAQIAIQGYRDELSSEFQADEAFYRQFRCPKCQSEMQKEFLGGPRGIGVTWVEDSILPRALLRCMQCKLLINPHTRMIVETGGFIPVIPIDDDVIGVSRRR